MWCFDCKKDVFGQERDNCHEKQHDLDFEFLIGPWRLKKLKPKRKSTLKFKKKISMTSEVPYE